MQEQSPSDQPRREPAAKGRRSRSPRPTFTPPPTPEPAPAEVVDDTPPRPRRATAAPTVLFQPPDPTQAAPAAEVPAAPRPRPSAEVVATTDAGTPAVAPPPAYAPADEPVSEEPPKRTRRAPAAKKATPPKKAAPAARKSAAAPKAPAALGATAPAETDAAGSEAARKAPAEPGTTASPGTDVAGTAGSEPGAAEPAATPAGTVTPARNGRARKGTRATPAKETAKRPTARRGSTASVEAAAPASSQAATETPGGQLPAETTAQLPPEQDAAQVPAEPTAPHRDQPEPPAKVELAGTRSAAGEAPATVQVERRDTGSGWRAVGVRVLEHPGFAPELLALAAVEALGPRAADWVDRTRDAYPDADADGLARLVTRRFVRLAGTGGALAAGAGLFAPVAELTAVLWTQANLVLHLAAVYGREPAHPDRVVELLVLTQVHPDAGTARAALDGVRSAGAPAEGSWSRAAEAAWRLATPLAAQAAGWLGLRLAARLLPGAAALAAATGDATAAERLAARAISLYRPTRRQSQPNQDFGRRA
ncbi:hypothetical protein RMN56_12495 [Micromonospora halotolerans]|uniref:EcsC family protein n=1 Tax=Micromonospora halotolerans TaxID=709879 RepID=A0ABZ0A406_9ACTN|nr:hypothetical protein [Micromonospora halotolerans]WNM42098.1 hypothetical protein RMN56_12495 [Micromonospora halotolerans]